MTGLFFKDALLPQGWARNVRLSIEAGRITDIAPDSRPEPGDEHHALALPGLPNLHSHAFQRGMAGLAEVRGSSSDSFWTWREVMYRFVERMTPDDIEAIAAQAYVEMLESGFTRVGEFHYVHHDVSGTPYQNIAELAVRIATASQATGIALTLLPVFYAHAGFGGRAPDAGQRRFINDLDRFSRLMEESRQAVAGQPAAIVGIAPHSLRAVTPDELIAIVPLAENGPIHIHVAEQTREVEECLAWSGQRPVAWLMDHAPIDRRWCFIHATHTTPDELRGMAEAGAIAGLCPITEANLGDGIFNAPEFLAHGGRYGVGSDSNVLIGAADELRLLEYSQRLGNRARNVVTGASVSTGRTLFDGALAGGAQALGAEAGLAVGHFADIASLETGHIAFAGRTHDAILDSWIFAAGRAAVDCVWVGGRKVVAGGRHHDKDKIAARFRQRLERLLAA
ncbi:formimidoylglutamate deiminase [Bradyrhizobium prioriisuperbiae]|uniref:formimidoylglutamate deiminase n=1 Tax=Bradyrhizobium prioriisuperbiae TaxID=2854389 RepID=UPI0028ECDAC1|nr:formimidoylglutamate deiminase [Bradyrhizobium prioritasuperba]